MDSDDFLISDDVKIEAWSGIVELAVGSRECVGGRGRGEGGRGDGATEAGATLQAETATLVVHRGEAGADRG